MDASYLADAVVLLRYFEARGEVRQAISVVKKRGGEHERTIREFRMANGTIEVGEPLRMFRGVLTGVPQYEGGDDSARAQMTTHGDWPVEERRVLILTPTGRDAAMTVDLLERAGIDAVACATLAELSREIEVGAAAVLVAEEAIADDQYLLLAPVLTHQPPWSDLPIVVLTSQGADSEPVAHAVRTLGNVTLLERPTRVAALVSAIRTALRARERQYQMRAHMRDREQVAESLNEADRRKDEFLAMLAHELRNPLAPISNAVQVLRLTKTADPVAVRMCEVMQRQVDHMVRLVDDLLDVSRITRGKITLHRERADLTSIIRNAVDISRPLIDAAGHRLSIHTLDTPILVDGDPIRLSQILANLLNNAAKYTAAGGTIHGDGPAARRPGGRLGPRYRAGHRARDAVARVRPVRAGFERRVRIETRPRHRTHAGQAARRASRRRRRGVQRRPRPRQRVRRDVAAAHRGRGRRRERPDNAAPERGLEGRRILVVDDNADGADSLGVLLEMLGADVRVVYSGHAALATLDTFRPSVVLLDIGMPELDGYEVARRMRQRAGTDRSDDRRDHRMGPGRRSAAITGRRFRRPPDQAARPRPAEAPAVLSGKPSPTAPATGSGSFQASSKNQ